MSRTRTADILAHIEVQDRAEKLRAGIVEMTIRYGTSSHRAGLAYGGDRLSMDKTWQNHRRASDRQFKAVMRLTRALANVSKEG